MGEPGVSSPIGLAESTSLESLISSSTKFELLELTVLLVPELVNLSPDIDSAPSLLAVSGSGSKSRPGS